MLTTLAVSGYRSLYDLCVPLARLNVVTGANGSGKSSLYRALRLLAESAQGTLIPSLAAEGGLDSTFWAGPEVLGSDHGRRSKPKRLRFGFGGEFGYAISLGASGGQETYFDRDPEVKRECIWHGDFYRPAAALVDRGASSIKRRDGRSWKVVSEHIPSYSTLFEQLADIEQTPEVFTVRETVRKWRFYDHFRTDRDAPARSPQIGTRTPVLHHDGRDLAAALQTIREIGDDDAMDALIRDAFPGAEIHVDGGQYFSLHLSQPGLLRPMSAAELSDGTLRYLLWVAALLTPRPPPLMVLNEPETSLHPELLPALGRLILHASKSTQVWVVSHASALVDELRLAPDCNILELEKEEGATRVRGMRLLDQPPWHWPDQ